MHTLIEKFNHLLTPQRMRYPWFIGGALWAGWIISLLAGKGNVDLAGHLIGTDFAAFYTAGKIILLDRSADLYNLELAHTIQQELYGGSSANFNPYLNPPHYALWMAPFAKIPYPWAPMIWIFLGLMCLWLSIKWLGVDRPARAFFLALTWLPVFYAASFGQNSFFSLAIFSLSYCLSVRRQKFWAGLAYSLILYKPQFVMGLSLLWLLEWRKYWKNILGLGIGCILQIGVNLIFLPEASLSYLNYAQKINANLMNVAGFPFWNAYSLKAFWMTLLPGLKPAPDILFWIFAGVGFVFFYKFYKKRKSDEALLFGTAVAWLVWTLPYLMVYDWTLLLFPAILIWKSAPDFKPHWRVIYAILWVVTFFSSALTFLMLRHLPFAIQLSIPALTIALAIAYRALSEQNGQNLPV